jgi:hypothetical protein
MTWDYVRGLDPTFIRPWSSAYRDAWVSWPHRQCRGNSSKSGEGTTTSRIFILSLSMDSQSLSLNKFIYTMYWNLKCGFGKIITVSILE